MVASKLKIQVVVLLMSLVTFGSGFIPKSSFTKNCAFHGTEPLVVVSTKSSSPSTIASRLSESKLHLLPFDTNGILLSAEPIDPAAAIGQALGGLINSPAILAVPILAAVGVASLIAFLIVSYANPADPDSD